MPTKQNNTKPPSLQVEPATPPPDPSPLRKIIVIAAIARPGINFGWALQLSWLTPYVQLLGTPHFWASFIWLCGPVSGLMVKPIVGFYSDRSSFATSGVHCKIAIAVDLSDESAYAVRWAAQNYLRPGDVVILLHVRPMNVLGGADGGSSNLNQNDADTASEESQQKLEEDFDNFTTAKASDLAQPLLDAP
ncbi:hypothetical protein K1719_044450 [Acacia pycnantha]|nr:hypothetical protein K1719_044450 [Acacia pycnantha]